MASKYRLNRYNWLGQKLLAQHKYKDILHLRQCLAKQQQTTNSSGLVRVADNQNSPQDAIKAPRVSEHLVYLSSLALMQTSNRLDEVVYSIQQLNFDTNSQYFLLLAKCLLYAGNHESVIALCERVIAKEINSSQNFVADGKQIDGDDTLESQSATQSDDETPISDQNPKIGSQESNNNSSSYLSAVAASNNDGGELKKLLQRIEDHANMRLVSEPRFWFILGLCLEHRARLADALLAYKLSSKLAFGGSRQMSNNSDETLRSHRKHHGEGLDDRLASVVSLNSFLEPHLKYAQLCIKLRADFKRASQALHKAVASFPQNYSLNPFLALVSCSGPNANSLSHFSRAMEMLANLENFSAANRNPSASYNNLALRCLEQTQSQSTLSTRCHALGVAGGDLASDSDDNKFKLGYLLVKTHLSINSIAQDSSRSANLLFSSGSGGGGCSNKSTKQSATKLALDRQLDQLIELMRASDVACWQSGSLWNNLAVCYLIRGKLIASLTCLSKAQQLEPLEWRIYYNLALACLQVELIPKALCSLFAAKRLHERSLATTRCPASSSTPQIITTLMAICFEKLNQLEEARRLHIEALRSQTEAGKTTSSTPILSIINYLIFLHTSADSCDPQTVKLKSHLLDLVEQLWLQRNQNDNQFNVHLLDVAREIGEELSKHSSHVNNTISRKTYAWTKIDEKL